MSSAILYLAIVAIWAGFLVPAWIRRPHASRSAQEPEFAAEFGSDAEIDLESSAEADLGGIHVEVSRHIQVSRHEHGDAAWPVSSDQADWGDEAGRSGEAGRRIEVSHDETPARVPVRHHARPFSAGLADHDGVPGYADAAGPGGDAGVRGAEDTGAPPAAGEAGTGRTAGRAGPPSQSRQQMMHARRRMLAILVGLTMLAFAATALGLAGWWICVSPTGILVLYVLLLREIAMAESEMAARRRQAHAAGAARQRAAWQAERAWAASQPEPTAQIIDISSRVGDQLYDQYADATVRAVGD